MYIAGLIFVVKSNAKSQGHFFTQVHKFRPPKFLISCLKLVYKEERNVKYKRAPKDFHPETSRLALPPAQERAPDVGPSLKLSPSTNLSEDSRLSFSSCSIPIFVIYHVPFAFRSFFDKSHVREKPERNNSFMTTKNVVKILSNCHSLLI